MPTTAQIRWKYGDEEGGSEVFELATSKFMERLADKSSLFAAAAHNAIHPAVSENFASQGGRVGGWDALAQSTVDARGSAEPILHDTGQLEASFDTTGPSHIEEFLPDSGFWGSDKLTERRISKKGEEKVKEYGAAWHQRGTTRMPARPILFMDAPLKLAIEAELMKFGLAAATGVFETTLGGVAFAPVWEGG